MISSRPSRKHDTTLSLADLSLDHLKSGNGLDDQVRTGGDKAARKLRRVASAPNTQGLSQSPNSDDRPLTAYLGNDPALHHNNARLPQNPLQGQLGRSSPGKIRQSDTINFGNVKESVSSMDMGSGGKKPELVREEEKRSPVLDRESSTPGAKIADPFEDFNTVTLQHDGEDDDTNQIR